jgi:hypothetical protein
MPKKPTIRLRAMARSARAQAGWPDPPGPSKPWGNHHERLKHTGDEPTRPNGSPFQLSISRKVSSPDFKKIKLKGRVVV